MQKILSLCYLLTLSTLPLVAEEETPSKIVYLTAPKGGSQLFRKAIGLLTERPLRKIPPLNADALYPFIEALGPYIGYTHLDPGHDALLNDQSPDILKAVMIRDPRDVIVSMDGWIQVMADTKEAKTFTKLPLETRISHLITAPDLSMNGPYPYIFDTHLVMQRAIQAIKNPTIFVCRFEDLVGAEGGGSRERQVNTLSRLAKHLKLHLSSEKIEEIADDLFGDTFTFRAGQIGAWSHVFTPENNELFKMKFNREMVELQYTPKDSHEH
jgi:hypothetical protein